MLAVTSWCVVHHQEVLPALLPILTPRLRPVAERLLNADERAALGAATSTMLAYGLRFDSKAASPAAVLAGGRTHVTHVPLKPAVDRLCAFQVRWER